MKDVSHDEFHKFISEYPRKLHKEVHRICDPAMMSYDDFTLGNWPECMVASCTVFHIQGNDRDLSYYKDHVVKGNYAEAQWSIKD